MGNVRFGTCDLCHLHGLFTVPTTETEILVNKQTPHFIEQQSERKPMQNRTYLHSFICVDSAALQQLNVEGLIYGPQAGGVLLQKKKKKRKLKCFFHT